MATSATELLSRIRMNPPIAPRNDEATRRQRARRTALWAAAAAVAVYVGFLLLNVVGK